MYISDADVVQRLEFGLAKAETGVWLPSSAPFLRLVLVFQGFFYFSLYQFSLNSLILIFFPLILLIEIVDLSSSSGIRCEYTYNVIDISVCPNLLLITVIGIPFDNKNVAWLCLKSCILIFLIFTILLNTIPHNFKNIQQKKDNIINVTKKANIFKNYNVLEKQ